MKVQIFRRPNRLKARVSGQDGGTSGSPGSVAPELLDRAQGVLADFSARYPDQAQIDVSRLLEAGRQLAAGSASCDDAVTQIRREALEIMGQGETFGYALLTRLNRSLYDCCAGLVDLSDKQRSLVNLHLDAIQLVVRGDVKGDGGAIGQELIQSLETAKSRFGSLSERRATPA